MIKSKIILFNITEDWFFCSHFLDRALTAQKNGFHVYVCCKENKHRKFIEKQGIKFIPLKYNRRSINPIYEFFILIRLIFIYKRISPDIVHNVASKPIIYGSIASKIINIKSVINAPVGMGFVFTSSSFKATCLKPIVIFLLVKLLSSNSGKGKKSKVIFENNDDQSFFNSLGALRNKDTCVIRGAGVKVNKNNLKNKVKNKLPTISLVARMLKDKGVYEYIEAAKILKSKNIPCRFLLVGDVDPFNSESISRNILKKWDQEKIIEWLGWVNNVNDILLKTDIMCLPSYREGLPKALLEAAAVGIPIVTTNAIGCREVVNNGINGYLVPIKDSENLSLAIEKLVKSKELRVKKVLRLL